MSKGIRSFAESDIGLFYSHIKALKYLVATTLVNTVAENKAKHNNRDYLRTVTLGVRNDHKTCHMAHCKVTI